MKRLILFKAQRIDNGEWVEGLPIFLTEYAKDFDEIDGVQCNKTRENFDVDPETVCQFTGLLDKNGNKIFEGDKINFSCAINGSFIDSVVEYDSIDGAWSINWDKEKNRVHYFFNEIEECEIIGNIHD